MMHFLFRMVLNKDIFHYHCFRMFNQEVLEMSGIHQLLVFANDINVLYI